MDDKIPLATLRLEPRVRPGEQLPGGASKAHRQFWDIIVNDVSLWEVTQRVAADRISCLWMPDTDRQVVERLLLTAPADLPHGRRSLYVCAECGAPDCGTISVNIERHGDRIVWRDFADQNDYDGQYFILDEFAALEGVCFDFETYYKTLMAIL